METMGLLSTGRMQRSTPRDWSVRILLVNKFYFPLGGTETCLFHLENLLRQKGHFVVNFSTRDLRNKASEHSRFFVEKIDYNRRDISLGQKLTFAARLLYSRDAARKMDALLRQTKPDIAHLHNICHQISPSILPVLNRRGIPIVQTLHDLKLACPNYRMLGPDGPCERCKGHRYYNVALQRCVKNSLAFSSLNCIEAYFHSAIRIYDLVDLFICPSRFNRDKLISFGQDPRRFRHLPNFVELDPSPSLSSGGYILFCGRLGSEKGLFTLLKAVQADSNIKLVIAGSGPEELPVRRYLSEKDVDNVELAGFLSGEERNRLIRRSSFMVVPSECYENCSLSVLEAFASGKPVVGSNIGGIPEQITPGVNGLLFEPGNVEDLREKIRYLVSHPEEVLRMGKGARQTAEGIYSPDAHYSRLMQIYSEAAAIHDRRMRRKGGRRRIPLEKDK